MALQQLSTGGATAGVAALDATSQASQQQQRQNQQQQNQGSSGFDMSQYLQDIAGIAPPVTFSSPVNQTVGGQAPQIFNPLPPRPTPQPIGFEPDKTPIYPVEAPQVPLAPPVSPDIQFDPFTQTTPGASDLFIGGGTSAAEAAVAAGGTPLNAGNPYPWDPFSFAGSGSQEGAALASETQSPGYQQFGQTWLDLLNTVQTQNLQWGGTNQFGGELKGGGSVGPWLQQNIVSPWSSGNQQKAYAGALDFISSQTGKPPTDPETQKMAGAFLEYTLQNSNRYGANTQNFDQRNAGGGKDMFGSILGPLEAIASIVQPELAPVFAVANLAEGAASGNLTPLGAIGDVFGAVGGGLTDLGSLTPELSNTLGFTQTAADIGPSLAEDASTLSDFARAGTIIGDVGTAANIGDALSSGNFLGAVGPAFSLGGSLDSLIGSGTPTGTAGTNATSSGGVMGSLSNTLGLSQEDLSKDLDYLMAAGSVAGTGIPLIERATQSPTQLNIAPPAAAPPPPAASPQPTAQSTPGTPGQALQAQNIFNPSAAGYQQPGPRVANPTPDTYMLMQILNSLGAPA